MNLLGLSSILLTIFIRISMAAQRINSFIPQYCKTLQYNPSLNIVELAGNGNASALVVTAYVYEGLKFNSSSECYVIIRAPPNFGIVTTVKKISFHENDTLVFQSSSNEENAWLQNDEGHKYKEILSLPKSDESSSIRMKYVPGVKQSEHMGGFEIAFTSYSVKGETCGDDFDCENDRCISSDFQCDGFNNCGNDQDEVGCAGVSLWTIILLILIGILVVVLAIFVWYRMAQR